jgi:hypothetical protein
MYLQGECSKEEKEKERFRVKGFRFQTGASKSIERPSIRCFCLFMEFKVPASCYRVKTNLIRSGDGSARIWTIPDDASEESTSTVLNHSQLGTESKDVTTLDWSVFFLIDLADWRAACHWLL